MERFTENVVGGCHRDETSQATLPAENVFGHTKKVRLLLGSLDRLREQLGRGLEILDVGCGNGTAVTRFLGGPGDRVLGIDEHVESIEYARRCLGSEALSFRLQRAEELCAEVGTFDAVVLADVLEHLDEPQTLLDQAAGLLRPGGLVLATVPNGWGPFEVESRVSRLPLLGKASLTLIDLFVAFLNRFIFRGAWTHVVSAPDAVPYNVHSGHVQFFSRRKLTAIAKESGLELRRLANLSWLSGPYTNYLWAPSRGFCEWNSRVADSLPAALVSAWFFEFRKAGTADPVA